jgi:integrase
MRKVLRKGTKNRPRMKLGIPDLERSKAVVLRSLRSPASRRGYQHAIDEFVGWYGSEPRLSFNKTVVLRYRIHLEDRGLAAATINVRLAAVRRLAYEAADCGLLSPELAAGIRQVKGVRKLGTRLGNWLTQREASILWQLPDTSKLKGKRDRAILAVLLGCGLRRRELAELTLKHIQQRDEKWAIIDLMGKGGHIRTVPLPSWIKVILDEWLCAGGIDSASYSVGSVEPVFSGAAESPRRSSGTWSRSMRGRWASLASLPMISAAPVPGSATAPVANWSRSSSYLGMSRSRLQSGISGASKD